MGEIIPIKLFFSSQVKTPAKENRAGAVPSAQAIFFAEMCEGTGHAWESSAFANSDLVIEAIDLAVARTDPT